MFFARILLGVIFLLGPQALAGETPSPGPPESLIKVTAKRFEYSPSTIQVKLNVPVVLELTTLDRVHGFEVPDLALRAERNVRFSLQCLLRKRSRRHDGTNRGDEVAESSARASLPDSAESVKARLIAGTSLKNLTRLPLPSPVVLPPSDPTEEAWTLRTIGRRRSSRHTCIA